VDRISAGIGFGIGGGEVSAYEIEHGNILCLVVFRTSS
jgi:hypothetical protein